MKWLPVLLLGALAACSRLPLLGDKPAPTIADLLTAQLPEEQAAPPGVSLVELATIYRGVLEVGEGPGGMDSATRLQVEHRLADIELLAGEARLAEAEDVVAQEEFAVAISSYNSLLQQYPENPGRDQLLYQLSRAYELSGDSHSALTILEQLSSEYPHSEYYLEAEFRRAESYFVAADYATAEVAYGEVAAGGAGSPYFVRALYMQGWARFKQDEFQQSILPFTATLDQLLLASEGSASSGYRQIEQLPRGEAEIAQDCLRVLALVFSYLQGADTIAGTYDDLGMRPYQHLFYQQLGDLYLAQERYRDSAETYRAYTRLFPDSKVAHQMQLRVIESYEAGGFAGLIVEEKQHYVDLFGVGQAYWLQSDENARNAMAVPLKQFIAELAGHYHALAQSGGASELPTAEHLSEQPKNPTATQYLLAGDYYQMYIDSFPTDSRVPAMGFLLAESRMDAGRYREAIEHYEWVAYSFSDDPRAADAAYAALLAYDSLVSSGGGVAAGTALQGQRIASELRFASHFSSDSRASLVLSHAASGLVELGDYPAAVDAATTLLHWQPMPTREIHTAALLALGHGSFELGQYTEAEHAYQQALAALPEIDRRYAGVVDRLAASIYRQAEQAVASEDFLQAADQFARVSVAAPKSAISVSAHFDAANNYLRAGDLAQANQLLIEFRQRYPQHDLSATVANTLVANYEQLQQWGAAAAELDTIRTTSSDPEQQRQALYLAAQYYDKASDSVRAQARYRSYASEWPRPLAERMEAMHRLAQLYLQSGQQRERQSLLAEMVAAQDSVGSATTERSLYLAAAAASALAEQAFLDYDAIPLRAPLKQSLKSKKAAMQAALAASQRAAGYGVQEFSTLAIFRMGQVYQQISSDLLASERPANIDALALEQYEMLLEEQAFPFEEKAIAIYETNARRSWEGVYDQWVQKSFEALADLLPARYLKPESGPRLGSQRSVELASDMARAQHWFEQSIDDHEGDLALYNQYGIFLREQGRFSAAEQVYLQALTVLEADANIHRNLGILYDIYRGDRSRALQHFYRYQALSDEDERMVSGWIADLERQPTLLVQGALDHD